MHADPAARRMMDRVFFVAGALLAGLAVAFGAFGAHALRAVLSPASLATFETAVRYQTIHALALLAIGWAVTRWPSRAAGSRRACCWARWPPCCRPASRLASHDFALPGVPITNRFSKHRFALWRNDWLAPRWTARY